MTQILHSDVQKLVWQSDEVVTSMRADVCESVHT